MKDGQHRILSIGAHQDDADTSSGGLLMQLHDQGWDVRMLSVTDGSAGTLHTDWPAGELKLLRRSEAAKSGQLLGARYDVMDFPDAHLMPTLEVREALIRYIRFYQPDIIVTNRTNDYHADHRNTAIAVQDASYLLTVPAVCPDVPALPYSPVILYWHDGFTVPVKFRPDLFVPMDGRVEALVKHAACHESQYFDWMYYPDHMEKRDWPREQQIADLTKRYYAFMGREREEGDALITSYCGAAAKDIHYVELFEISEYGDQPTQEMIDQIQKWK